MGSMHSYKLADLGLRSVKYELLGFPLSILLTCRSSKATYLVLQRLDGSELHKRAAPALEAECDLQCALLVGTTAVAEVILNIISSVV